MSILTAGFSNYPGKWNCGIRLLPQDRLFAATIIRLVPRRVKPNHLTVLRLLLIGPVVLMLGLNQFSVGVPLFLFAALTDALDGSLARSRKQISEWGIIADPLADKLLVGAVIALVVIQRINLYLGVALLAMEVFMIYGGWRQIKKGIIEPANFWGKAKMLFEVCGITLLLIAVWMNFDLLIEVSTGTLALALVFAIVSVMIRLR